MRFVLSFCLFVFSLMGKDELGGNPVYLWLSLYFCFVCCVDVVIRVLLVFGWLYSSGFLCVSSHYLILPRVSSREGNGNPTPVLLPGKSHGWRSLVGCSP